MLHQIMAEIGPTVSLFHNGLLSKCIVSVDFFFYICTQKKDNAENKECKERKQTEKKSENKTTKSNLISNIKVPKDRPKCKKTIKKS